jgi:superfamily I DNA/RNA helicase
MLAENGTQTVIGDEDQSIYSFRCAHPQGIAEFENYHPGTSNESLAECRRCSHLVVELANSLIQNNTTREDRTLVPFPCNPQGEVHVIQWDKIEEEAEGITKFINQKIEKGEVSPGGILVLAPRRQFGYAIRDSLNASGIPAASFFQEELLDGKPAVMNKSQAQQAITLLTLLVNPDDRVALRCWCGFGSVSLNRSAWIKLKEYCQREDLSPKEALDMLREGSIRIPYTNPILNRYNILIERLEELKNLDQGNFLQSLFPMGQSWSDPFRYIIRDLDEDEIQPDIVLDALRTSITQPELPTDVDYVRVMSLHKSKGLSSDMVVVVGCSEGLIPPRYDKNKTELSEKDFIEEARRLFYVAITRSRNILILSNVVKIPLSIAHKMQAKVIPYQYTDIGRTVTSRFISELGPSSPRAVRGENLL